jgi:hypothetical protein
MGASSDVAANYLQMLRAFERGIYEAEPRTGNNHADHAQPMDPGSAETVTGCDSLDKRRGNRQIFP